VDRWELYLSDQYHHPEEMWVWVQPELPFPSLQTKSVFGFQKTSWTGSVAHPLGLIGEPAVSKTEEEKEEPWDLWGQTHS
jgi:hypothetical protein